jgi:hypothetical protein
MPKKSVYEIALEVIRGTWGAGQERFDRLTQAGYDPDAVQNMVNRIMSGDVPAYNETPKGTLHVTVDLNKYDSIMLEIKI